MIHSRILFTLLLSFAAYNSLQASQAAQTNVNVVEMNDLLINSPSFPQERGLIQIRCALSGGADVNAQDEDGNTLLINACREARVDIVNLLITTQSDLEVNLTKGSTPLELTFWIGHNSAHHRDIATIITLLTASGATFNKDNIPTTIFEKLLYKELTDAYIVGRVICRQREKAQETYEQEITKNLEKHVPVKDLNNIISDYNKISILQFVAMQKQHLASERSFLQSKK